MTVAAVQVAVTAAATRLTPPGDPDSWSALLTNVGSTTVFLGDAAVTPSTGTPLLAGGQVGIDLFGSESLYGICAASGSSTVAVLMTGR